MRCGRQCLVLEQRRPGRRLQRRDRLDAAGQTDRPHPSARSLRKPVLRRTEAQSPVHGREPVDLRGLREHARRGTRITRRAPAKKTATESQSRDSPARREAAPSAENDSRKRTARTIAAARFRESFPAARWACFAGPRRRIDGLHPGGLSARRRSVLRQAKADASVPPSLCLCASVSLWPTLLGCVAVRRATMKRWIVAVPTVIGCVFVAGRQAAPA